MMKTDPGLPSLRYKLSHHSMVVMLPNLNQYDQIQHSPRDMITHHMCATSWLWVPAMRFLAAMSAFSGSTRYAAVRPVIKPCPNTNSPIDTVLKYKTDKRLPSSPSHQHRNRSLQEYPASAADTLYRTPARTEEVPSV